MPEGIKKGDQNDPGPNAIKQPEREPGNMAPETHVTRHTVLCICVGSTRGRRRVRLAI